MQLVGVHHVSLNVPDVAEATAFYVDKMGFVERHDRPDFGFPGAWIDVGAHQLHLIEAAPPGDLGQHFAVHVTDIKAAVAELRAKGVEVSEAYPVPGAGQQAFLHDPAGNLIELNQPGAA